MNDITTTSAVSASASAKKNMTRKQSDFRFFVLALAGMAGNGGILFAAATGGHPMVGIAGAVLSVSVMLRAQRYA